VREQNLILMGWDATNSLQYADNTFTSYLLEYKTTSLHAF